jgi:hypothetical protein
MSAAGAFIWYDMLITFSYIYRERERERERERKVASFIIIMFTVSYVSF